jgi:hypothetical protein
MPALISFFQWCDDTPVSQAIRNSRVAFPIIENFHLFALTVLLGSLVILALRQFGLVYKTQTISEVANALRPWNRWSLAVMLASGILPFLSEAMKCYGNTSFRVKMLFLFAALLFQFTIYNRTGGVGTPGPAHWEKSPLPSHDACGLALVLRAAASGFSARPPAAAT